LGENVRFDGGHKRNSFIAKNLQDYFKFQPFCPEVAIGLNVPRQAVRLIASSANANEIECVGSRDRHVNVTQSMTQLAQSQQLWQKTLSGYIVKKDSPSCGMARVKVYSLQADGSTGHAKRRGVGLYTQVLMQNFPHLPVEEEGRLGDAILRENFLTRVCVYHRFQELQSNGVSRHHLMQFHAHIKHTLLSHHQLRARALGKRLATLSKFTSLSELKVFADEYLAELMGILRINASRKNHMNVMQHLQGYLKKQLTADEKQELSEVIVQYRRGILPLIVPITLLRHFFRRYPNAYIQQSSYLYSHPNEMMLLNRL
jgi:uncharacterized protein YbgA (DUF1722 family)/uncharacterized protein YbbK (DUF523 family)